MKSKIMYIENKSYGHHGPAWIGLVEFSKSGQTVYFNNKALKKLKNPGTYGNHFDIETGEEYWVSGVKKNGQDRHWCGGGKIMLDKTYDAAGNILSVTDRAGLATTYDYDSPVDYFMPGITRFSQIYYLRPRTVDKTLCSNC